MNQPKTPTEHLTGVWISPDNTRVDIVEDGGRWVATSGDQHNIVGRYVTTFDDADELRAGIGRLEAAGSIRQPAVLPRPAPHHIIGTVGWVSSPVQIIGPLILFILIVAIGIAIIN